MARPKQTHCCRGHAFAEHGRVNTRGYHTCNLCRRLKSRYQVGTRRRVCEMGALLRQGLALGVGEHEALQAWQRKVWALFERLESVARSGRDHRRKVAA